MWRDKIIKKNYGTFKDFFYNRLLKMTKNEDFFLHFYKVDAHLYIVVYSP